VVWTEGGELLTFGHGGCGKLGHGAHGNERVPRLVEALAGKKVVGASAGEQHAVVWTEGGEVYSFGDGHGGKLGHGAHGNERVPRLVEGLAGKKVVGASAGATYTVVWTEGGEVYTFGFGRWGNLGHGGLEDELVPRLVEGLAGGKVVGASAGQYHSVVWTEGGEVYSCGDGGDGQLGHGRQGMELVPRVLEALSGKKVVGAAAGFSHTVVWTEGGDVYTFGGDDHGELGRDARYGGVGIDAGQPHNQFRAVPGLIEPAMLEA
jgi:RCC1 and BTB domain-containing protein